jgi:hypothetical protein
VREERKVLSSAITTAEDRLRTVRTLENQLSNDKARLERRLEEFDERLKQLDEWKREPVVLVRTSVGGYGTPVYHDAKEPCGYMWNRDNFRSMLLAEAEEEGHRPCSACGNVARRRRLAAAA